MAVSPTVSASAVSYHNYTCIPARGRPQSGAQHRSRVILADKLRAGLHILEGDTYGNAFNTRTLPDRCRRVTDVSRVWDEQTFES